MSFANQFYYMYMLPSEVEVNLAACLMNWTLKHFMTSVSNWICPDHALADDKGDSTTVMRLNI